MDDDKNSGTPPDPAPGGADRRRSWRSGPVRKVSAGAPPPPEDVPAHVPPPPPPADQTVTPRRSTMALRLIGVGLALVLAIVITLVVVVFTGPPTVDDLRREAKLDTKRELLIGVKNDQPGVAEFRDGRWAGFDIDIAHMIAEDLGFRRTEVRFLAIESEDRARMQATDVGDKRVSVDLVIASYSITPDREDLSGVAFSAPYLFTEQSVVTLNDHKPVSTLEDLAGKKVCSLATATSETAAKKAGAVVLSQKVISDCFKALDGGGVDAVSTDAAILAGYKHRFPTRYQHWDIGLEGTEAWGVNVGENEALRDLVNLTLYRSREDPKDSRWEDAYDANFGIEQEWNGVTPIAVDVQPEVKEPDVRQWPWERVDQ